VNKKAVIQIDIHLAIEKECDKQYKINISQNGLPVNGLPKQAQTNSMPFKSSCLALLLKHSFFLLIMSLNRYY
jgi:hypothetical protein